MQKETVPFKDGLSFYTTKERRDNSPLFMVEVTGLEPTTSWSLTKRATKLRYTSNKLNCRGERSFHDLLVLVVAVGCSLALHGGAMLAMRAPLLLFPKISLRCDFREPCTMRATKLRYTSFTAYLL